jgi:hypothetical protein
MKALMILATSGALALASVAAPTAADARCRGCGIAAGVIGGIAAGAAIAAATSPRYYGPAYDYAPGYAYGPGYAYEGYPAPYGYYGYRYGGSTADYTNMDRQLQGTR